MCSVRSQCSSKQLKLILLIAATIVLSSIAGAAEYPGHRLGEFVEAGEHGGRPYYKQRDTEGSQDTFLFSEGGRWWDGSSLGELLGGLLNRVNSDDPPIDGWLFYGGGKFNSDDTSLTLESTAPSPCQLVRVTGEGNVVDKQGSSLGDYR